MSETDEVKYPNVVSHWGRLIQECIKHKKCLHERTIYREDNRDIRFDHTSSDTLVTSQQSKTEIEQYLSLFNNLNDKWQLELNVDHYQKHERDYYRNFGGERSRHHCETGCKCAGSGWSYSTVEVVKFKASLVQKQDN